MFGSLVRMPRIAILIKAESSTISTLNFFA
jgi:hypothetical protein